MPAGHDFNALLIGALYGELSAVEESRLQAHLAAHPGDHEILRELTRTREAIRASAALSIVEPPQAISARLLQEAARRSRGRTAEVDAVTPGGRWLRWLSSLMAHPGLAAAAMAVLVVGVFGTMYLRNKHEVTESLLSEAPSAPSGGAAPSAASPAEGLAAGSGAQGGDLLRQQQSAPAITAGQARDYNASPVAATTPATPAPVLADPAPSGPAKNGRVASEEGGLKPQDSYAVDLDADGLDPALVRDAKQEDAQRNLGRGDRAQPTVRATIPAPKPAPRPGYLEARPVPDEIELKDYDDEKPRKEPPAQEREAAKAAKADKDKSDDTKLAQRRAPAPEPPSVMATGELDDATGADLEEARAEKPAKPAVAKKSISSAADTRTPAPERTVRPVTPAGSPARSSDLGGGASGSKGAPGSGGAANAVTGAGKLGAAPRAGTIGSGGAASAKPSPPADAAPPPPAITAAPTATTSSESVSLVDDSWAKSEHVRLVRMVRANKCSEAAKIARGVAERAPRYYQDRIAGSGDIRVCEPAIRDQLNLSEQSKRKRNRGAPAAADEAQRK